MLTGPRPWLPLLDLRVRSRSEVEWTRFRGHFDLTWLSWGRRLESGGDLLLLVSVFAFAGCEHVQGAVAWWSGVSGWVVTLV